MELDSVIKLIRWASIEALGNLGIKHSAAENVTKTVRLYLSTDHSKTWLLLIALKYDNISHTHCALLVADKHVKPIMIPGFVSGILLEACFLYLDVYLFSVTTFDT